MQYAPSDFARAQLTPNFSDNHTVQSLSWYSTCSTRETLSSEPEILICPSAPFLEAMESEREIDREAEELFRDFRFSIRLGRRQEAAKDYAPWRRILAEKGMESGDGEAPAQEEETENDSMDAGPSVEADFC